MPRVKTWLDVHKHHERLAANTLAGKSSEAYKVGKALQSYGHSLAAFHAVAWADTLRFGSYGARANLPMQLVFGKGRVTDALKHQGDDDTSKPAGGLPGWCNYGLLGLSLGGAMVVGYAAAASACFGEPNKPAADHANNVFERVFPRLVRATQPVSYFLGSLSLITQTVCVAVGAMIGCAYGLAHGAYVACHSAPGEPVAVEMQPLSIRFNESDTPSMAPSRASSPHAQTSVHRRSVNDRRAAAPDPESSVEQVDVACTSGAASRAPENSSWEAHSDLESKVRELIALPRKRNDPRVRERHYRSPETKF